MHRIVATVTSLAQHLSQLARDPESYRPPACPHCGLGKLWRHGCYHRKVERSSGSNAARAPVPIPRFRCADCQRTCSRLPVCIAPRRWYDWVVQQLLLRCLTGGASLHAAARACVIDRHTARRWRDWLAARGETFAFFLRSRFPDWGREGDTAAFWRTCLAERALPELMAWLDRDLIVP
jgi:transposase-like protein